MRRLHPSQTAMTNPLTTLADRLKEFARARDWEQFHSPKNLVSALSVEAGELLEHFMWLSEEQSRTLSPDKREEVAGEMADVLLYLIQLGTSLDVDLVDAAQRKIALNEVRYPVERARGNSRKHDEL